LTPLFFIVKILGGNEWFMAVKLAVLKSGEDVVADIKELCEYKVAFYPWQPLSAERDIPVRSDWIVSISEPIELVKKSYQEKMNGRDGTDGSSPE
jgi:hypothetical protein